MYFQRLLGIVLLCGSWFVTGPNAHARSASPKDDFRLLKERLERVDQRLRAAQKKKKNTAATWRKLGQDYYRIAKGKLNKLDAASRELQKIAALSAVHYLTQGVGLSSTNIAAHAKCVRAIKKRCLKWRWTKQRIPAAERLLVRATKLYLKLAPRSKYRPNVLFNLGHVYWRRNQFGRSMPFFREVSKKYADNRPSAARLAALRIAKILFILRRHKKRDKIIASYLASKKLMQDDDFADKMTTYWEKALWAKAGRLHRKKKWLACGRAFEAIMAQFPDSDHEEDYLYNASLCYHAGKKHKAARRIRLLLLKNYPATRHYSKVTKALKKARRSAGIKRHSRNKATRRKSTRRRR